MDRYQRVEKPRPEVPINENEIRITTQGRMRNYITYATTLLQVFLSSTFYGIAYFMSTTGGIFILLYGFCLCDCLLVFCLEVFQSLFFCIILKKIGVFGKNTVSS